MQEEYEDTVARKMKFLQILKTCWRHGRMKSTFRYQEVENYLETH